MYTMSMSEPSQALRVPQSISQPPPLPTSNPCKFDYATTTIVGFFISVSSLKVFGHSIHSERRRIYPGKSIEALQNDTIIIHGYSVS